MKGKYSIGLDIGTASVGYACLDENFNTLNFRGKDALGVHLFESADTAEARRLQRGMRRRYNRRVKRIQLLQELFSPLIDDPNFFAHINEQHRWNNNNNFENRTLSEMLKEVGYSGEEIHDKFPTIYHLRSELINSKEKIDLRLIYLALHNLVKHRGHFLLGNNISWEERKKQKSTQLLDTFFEKYYELNNMSEIAEEEKLKRIDSILRKMSMTNNDKQKEIQKELSKGTKDIGRMLTGLKFNLSNIFHAMENNEELKAEKTNDKIQLSDEPENLDFSLLTDDQYELIEMAQGIFLEMTLDEILGASKCIADAKVQSYKENRKQLKKIKTFLYEYHGHDVVRQFFVSEKKALKNYQAKPDKTNLGKLSYFDQYRYSKGAGRDKFFKELRKIMKLQLANGEAEDQRKTLLNLVENDEFLAFQKNVSNASIPVQNSSFEAESILKKQKRHYEGITEDLIEKVIQIITFRIPYYIGPLIKGEGQSEFGWLERKEQGQNVTPFNYEEVVDKGESAERFIRRMTNKCSYLLNEDVLPKHSLLYQEMEVLNELNGINLKKTTEKTEKRNRLPVNIKAKVYEHHFKNNKKVTIKNLKEFLERAEDEIHLEGKEITGTQKADQFASSLSSYVDFRKILGKEKLESHLREVEIIISWLTIFNEKSIIEEKLKDNFDFLSEEEMERILKLDYKGWGRVSKKALTVENDGTAIIDLMRDSDYTFMEAYTSRDHDFKEIFRKLNNFGSGSEKIEYNDIEALKGSPALKKAIWSSVKIVEEIVSIFGEPESIILEFAREEGEKGKRTVSKEEQWKQLIKDNKLDKQGEFEEMFEQLKDLDKDIDYSMEKMWLYLLQGGKCIYTGQRIDLRALLFEDGPADNRTNTYEVDHILPRSFVKDDSIDNKVLVLKKANQKKSGNLMPLQIIESTAKKHVLRTYWENLKDNKMMSSRKYYRLLKEEFTDQDKEGFIARQLVETRQISVHVRDLLEERFNEDGKDKKVSIEVLKAGIIFEVRKKLYIPKIRGLNDHHHAVDALLVAGTYRFGNLISPKYSLFSFDFRSHKAKEKWKELQTASNTSEFNENLFLITSMKKKELINGKTFEKQMKCLIDEADINVTKKTGSSEGSFYKQSIFSPKIKTAKYNSEKNKKFVHDEVKKSFGILIEYFITNKKGEVIRKSNIVDTTVMELAQHNFENNEKIAEYYARKTEGSNEVIHPSLKLKIYKNDLVYIGDDPFYFVSSGELVNAKQLQIDNEMQERLHTQYARKWEFEVNEAVDIYNELAKNIIDQYSHILPVGKEKKEQRKEKILNHFSDTKRTHDDFVASVNELLKVSSASPARSEKLGGRYPITASRMLQEGRYGTTSVTGLKYRKPKQLIKFLEQ